MTTEKDVDELAEYIIFLEGKTAAMAMDSARLDKLFMLLPFRIRHQYGGDPAEFREGIDAARITETKP